MGTNCGIKLHLIKSKFKEERPMTKGKKTTGSVQSQPIQIGKDGQIVPQIDGSFHAGRKRKRTPKKAAKASS